MFGLFESEARNPRAESIGRWIARKRYGRAAAALRHQIARNPDSVSLRLRLVDVLLLEDRSGEALSVLQGLADELVTVGAVDKAIAVLRKILRIVPAHPAYRERLEHLLGRRQRNEADREPVARERRRIVAESGWSAAEIQALHRAPVFAGLFQRALFRLVRELPVRAFEPGEAIITEGEPGDSLWVVAAGSVEVRVHNPLSGSAPVRTLNRGDHFGEISLLTGQPRTATVVAVTASRLLELDAARLESLARRHPQIATTLRATCRQRALSLEEVEARGGIDFML